VQQRPSAEPADGSVPVRPWRGRPARDRLAERRRRLLDAGLQEFGTRGYATSTVAGLAAAAGLSNRYFYEQFADREALLRAVYDEVVAGAQAALVDGLRGAPPHLADRVRAGVRAFWAYQTADPRRPRVQSVEVIGVSPAVDTHRRAVIHAFADIITAQHAEFVAAGYVRPRTFHTLAVGLVGAFNEVLIDWVQTDPSPATGPIVDDLCALTLATLLHT
jgi:AcrR family transcriptional regulator